MVKDIDNKDVVEARGFAEDEHYKYRIAKQICLVMIFGCVGLTTEMIGPTLPDLKDRIGVNYEEISRALVGKSIGTMVGCVIGGFIHERFCTHTDLINTVSLLILASGGYITPWSQSIPMATVCIMLMGISEGMINAGGNTMVMYLWKDKAASPLHSLHFGYGLGAVIAPQIARFFLSNKVQVDNRSLNRTINTTFVTYKNNTMTSDLLFSTEIPWISEYENSSKIEIPFSIASTLVLIMSMIVLYFYVKGPPKTFPLRKNTTNFIKMISPGSCAKGHSRYGFVLMLCLFFYFFHTVGGEISYSTLLFSFGVESNLVNKQSASLLLSAYWISFTLGRLLGIPFTKFVHLNLVMIINIVVVFISASSLAVFAMQSNIILWILNVVLGLGMALVYPNGMSLANLRLDMNSIGVMVFIIGASFGGFIYQYISGYLFEVYGPIYLMYVMTGYITSIMIIFIIVLSIVKLWNPFSKSLNIKDNEAAENLDSTTDIKL